MTFRNTLTFIFPAKKCHGVVLSIIQVYSADLRNRYLTNIIMIATGLKVTWVNLFEENNGIFG